MASFFLVKMDEYLLSFVWKWDHDQAVCTHWASPPSVTNDSVGSRTAAACNVGAAIVAHVACSGCSRIDAVRCNWKRFQILAARSLLFLKWIFHSDPKNESGIWTCTKNSKIADRRNHKVLSVDNVLGKRSFQAHCAKRQRLIRVNQNMISPSMRAVSEVASSIFMISFNWGIISPWNGFEVLGDFHRFFL